MRIGIVGHGWAADAHITSFNEIQGTQVVAICSRRDLDGETLSARYKSPISVFNNLEEMCRADIDLVSICTPHPLHPEQVEICAAAGKHLVIEKPVGIDLEGVRRVEKAVKNSGVKALVCFEVKVVGHFKTMRAMIDQGLLGDIHYGECDYYHGIGPWYDQFGWNKRKDFGGSSLLTAGCHALDGLIWLMGNRPVEVFSYSTASAAPTFSEYEYPTTTTTVMKFENGAVGKTASVIDAIQPYLLNVHLVGAKGTIWNDKFFTTELGGLNKERWSRVETPMLGSGDVGNHPYRELFEDFIQSLETGQQPIFSFEDAIFSHRVCLAADLSASESRPVSLEEMS